MWNAAIIVFREIFEIAIVLCVILAATKEMAKSRNKWIIIGIIAGVAGASIFAFMTQSIALLSFGKPKLYFNASVLLAATLMIAWTVIWMKQHGRTLAADLNRIGRAVTEGTTPIYMLSVVVGLAVMREGSEIVLFLYGLASSGGTTLAQICVGALIGLSLGCGFGMGMYLGLLRVKVKYLFDVTSALLTFIAAGMAANAAGKLVHAGLLPALVDSMWNTSHLLSQHSLPGRFLSVLIGYQENPNGMQVLFYLLTIVVITAMLYRNTYSKRSQAAT